MGGSHSHHGHGHDHASEVPVSSLARLALLMVLGMTGVLTVWGLVALWPHSDPHPSQAAAAFAAPGVTFPHSEVVKTEPACANPDQASGSGAARCGQVTVKVSAGSQAGRVVTIPVAPEVFQLRPPAW